MIEFNGKQQWCHANYLRKYKERVTEVIIHNCSIIFDIDCQKSVVLMAGRIHDIQIKFVKCIRAVEDQGSVHKNKG